jgi:hypothetical protein
MWPQLLFREQMQKKWSFVTATTLIWQFFQDHPMVGRQARSKTLSKRTIMNGQTQLLYSKQGAYGYKGLYVSLV